MKRMTRWIAIFCFCGLFAGCKDAMTRDLEKKMEQVNWQGLEFVCKQETYPNYPADSEAEKLYRLGNALYKKGQPEDLIQSALALEKAAELGHVKAMNNLLLAYLNGDGVEQSDKQAVHWAKEMMAREVAAGYYHMGTFLEQGVGVKQDRVAALTYFRRAADLGSAQGQLVVGKKIIWSVYPPEVDPSDREKGFSIGIKILECALKQKNSEAGYVLGMHYSLMSDTKMKEQTAEAFAAFQAAAALGHEESLYWLHSAFRDGRDGVQKDPYRASQYYALLEKVRDDPSLKFPNIESEIPLPDEIKKALKPHLNKTPPSNESPKN